MKDNKTEIVDRAWKCWLDGQSIEEVLKEIRPTSLNEFETGWRVGFWNALAVFEEQGKNTPAKDQRIAQLEAEVGHYKEWLKERTSELQQRIIELEEGLRFTRDKGLNTSKITKLLEKSESE